MPLTPTEIEELSKMTAVPFAIKHLPNQVQKEILKDHFLHWDARRRDLRAEHKRVTEDNWFNRRICSIPDNATIRIIERPQTSPSEPSSSRSSSPPPAPPPGKPPGHPHK